MAGYLPSSSIKRKIKNEANNQPSLPHAWSIKELYGQKITPKNVAFAETKRAIPSGQDTVGPSCPLGSQHTEFASSCPLAEPAM